MMRMQGHHRASKLFHPEDIRFIFAFYIFIINIDRKEPTNINSQPKEKQYN